MEQSKLFEIASARLAELSKSPSFKGDDSSIEKLMDDNGISRRDFMKWAAGMTAMLSLPASFTPLVAQAAELTDRVPVIWLHMAECTGCSESFIRTADPSVATLIFDYISLEYDDLLMAASGWQAEAVLEHSMEKYYGKYILMVEGGIPLGDNGDFLTIGAHATTGKQRAIKACDGAAAIFAIGTCSSFGGIQAAFPNPTNAQALSYVTNKQVINVPGCPPSEKNIVGQIMFYILFGSLPALDVYNRPLWAYKHRIHDLCERRGHFDAGEFVNQFGDQAAENGHCLYRVGCKGPYTFNNCSEQRFNQTTSWPVEAGHGCIGCSEPDFWDTMGIFEEPLADRLYRTTFFGGGADATADVVGVAVLSVTALAVAAHATISMVKAKENEKKDSK